MTLIEIVIGITIISFGVVFIISSFSLGMRISGTSQGNSVGLFLASEKMEEIHSLIYDEIAEGVFVEDFGEIQGFEGHKRETEITCFDPESGDECQEDSGIKKVKISVFFKPQEEKSVDLTALISKK